VELTPAPDPAALPAALLQLSEHAEILRSLDAHHNAHAAEAMERLTALARTVADLAARLDQLSPGSCADPEPTYQPAPPHRFWQAPAPDRDTAIARLRAWAEQVYQPGYGHLAAQLGACWDQHPLCVYTLDWLSELWSVLYLQPFRTTDILAGQAEWQTRLLPAAAAQMAAETARCAHARAARSHLPGPRP